MEFIDNTSHILRDDLASEIKDGSKIAIIASCFSIYAYQALKSELKGVSELRFIFDSPTFTTEKYSKENREFYIPRADRERSVCGTEFEIRLRNELQQKAIARECADWIRRKVRFKSNMSNSGMNRFIAVDDKIYEPVNEFSTVGLGTERGNLVSNFVMKNDESTHTKAYIRLFETLWNDRDNYEDVTAHVLDNITAAYKENSPEFIYFVALYNIFSEFLEDISEDVLPNEASGYRNSRIWNMLYDFQRDAALSVINKLEKYNGCILADSVGLGKTFTALAVIKYYENRNKNVLVLCPKKLYANWSTFKSNYKNNPIAEDRLRYDVLFHTDVNRASGNSNGLDLSAINWGNYDLVVIDESHNFRNGGKLVDDPEHKDNRYEILMKKVIRAGVKTKVLMLSATPVNTKFTDLRNQLQLAYEGDSRLIDEKLSTSSSINDIFKKAQKAFNTWSKFPSSERTTEGLLHMLDFDFFEVLDSVTIDHITYNMTDGVYDNDIFTAEKTSDSFANAFRSEKSIQDFIFTDGLNVNSTERKFAEALERAEEVAVYAKLPRGFQIPTPVGNYAPDWAIAFKKGFTKHLYFIAETKGSLDSMSLREIERVKIKCVTKLFNDLSSLDVQYHQVATFDDLLDMIK